MTHTWLNVTTGHSRSNLIDLAGTTVLNYDIRGAADLLSSTAYLDIYVTETGHKRNYITTGGSITVNTSGNVKSGSYDYSTWNNKSGRN